MYISPILYYIWYILHKPEVIFGVDLYKSDKRRVL